MVCKIYEKDILKNIEFKKYKILNLYFILTVFLIIYYYNLQFSI